MEKYVYLKKKHSTHFVEFDEELSSELYDNLGITWEDYEDNKWVLLTSEQLAFHEEHPNATPHKVFYMISDEDIKPTARTLEDAKMDKMMAIDMYDSSDNVNSFTISADGGTFEAWLTPDQRANYKNSLDSAELLGLTEVHPVFNGQQLTLPTQMAKMALAQIQIYADRCFIVTEQHKAAVEALDTIEAVDNYDNTTGYPEKLMFEVPIDNAEGVVIEEQE